jgi:hypothetical protein
MPCPSQPLSEASTGLALLIAQSLVARLLLGEELSAIAIPVARVAGIALIALRNRLLAQEGRVAGMMTYSVAVTVYLAYLGFTGGSTGIFLWPAVVLHVILTACCWHGQYMVNK